MFCVAVLTLLELVFKENNKIDDNKNVNESTKNTTEPLQPFPYETINSINFASEKIQIVKMPKVEMHRFQLQTVNLL